MPIVKDAWVTLAGGFPPTLVTSRPESALDANESPVATGLNATAQGYLAAGTIPTGTARVARQYTITSAYTWHYKRLWRASGATLIYNAPYYTTVYWKQGYGMITFPETTKNVLTFMPIGGSALAVFMGESSVGYGAYIVGGANGEDDNFSVSDLIQEAKITTATHAVELNGVVYFINATGVFALQANGQVTEISDALKDSPPTPAALTCDYANQLLVVGTTHAYDPQAKRWLKYSGSTFEYQTRALQREGGVPFSVLEVAFEYDKTDAHDRQIVFATLIEGRDWSNDLTVDCIEDRGTQKWASVHLPECDTGRTFKIRINEAPTGLRIKRILVRVEEWTNDSRGH